MEKTKAKAKTKSKVKTKHREMVDDMARKKARTVIETKTIESLHHGEYKRVNIPTAEYQSILRTDEQQSIKVAFARRNQDLDPQIVWRGKDSLDWSELHVAAPPLYIQEKVHPKVLIDNLSRISVDQEEGEKGYYQPSLFDQFNGLPKGADKTEFYQHDQNWSNRMILGDALQVMTSLAEREHLRGSVQCIYIDPPYGIRFNSNFQWSTTSRDVIDGNLNHITREPEQVKAFRDTWRDGIHTYLTYLRDRLTVARDLLSSTGSIFVQIGDENVHRVRCLLDEVFGDDNFVVSIPFVKKGNQKGRFIESISDNLLWYAKSKDDMKFRSLFKRSQDTEELDRDFTKVIWDSREFTLSEFSSEMGQDKPLKASEVLEKYPDAKLFTSSDLTVGGYRANQSQLFEFRGKLRDPGLKKNRCWMHTSQPTGEESISGLQRLMYADRITETRGDTIRRRVYFADSGLTKLTNWWSDTSGASDPKYVVETNTEVVKRCILMTTDPGDLVLDPTCGSGTTAYVAEQWGRRWITVDTSRVALTLARSRLMSAKFPYYTLLDTPEGISKESELSGKPAPEKSTFGSVRQGFVYQRVARITSSMVANNNELDVIWQKWEPEINRAIDDLNKSLNGSNATVEIEYGFRRGEVVDFSKDPDQKIKLPDGKTAPVALFEWEIPRKAGSSWPEESIRLLERFWEARSSRQQEIDVSVMNHSECEMLYDSPIIDRKKVRVSGPFTVESLTPHRMLSVSEDDESVNLTGELREENEQSFIQQILENLRTAGVQQTHKEDRIEFESLLPWPGGLVCAEAIYAEMNSSRSKRAAIFIGPEFGTVTRPDLVEAAREAADSGFDVLIACAFNFEAHTTEFTKLGKIPVLKARMNADLHMSDDLKNTGKGNLFVLFGEPDVEMREDSDGLRVKILGVDVFDPRSGDVRSDGAEGVACWFIDTDYNEESFFVRHAYFLGAGDPYKSLRSTLKDEINEEAWESLYSDTSRPFKKPKSGRVAVKVINHLGDEVMKVIRVD